jgi:hypothetical protein
VDKIFFTLGILFLIIIPLNPLYGQVKQSHEIVLGNLQLKDQHNLGMVFNGIQLEYRYGLLWKINKHEILYQPKVGFGFVFSRGMAALQLPKIAPINVTWTIRFYEQNRHTIKGGANLITDYSYQWYPYLHGGRLFWMSEIGISPVIRYNYQWKSKSIGVYVQNSLFGFTSHTQKYDPYWQPIMKNWIVEPHKNMRFGSYNTYNHTTISFEFVPNIEKKHSILYEFDYFGSFYGMKFSLINHNLIWRIAL